MAKVYPLDDGTFCVADKAGWLPGYYATREAAEMAATVPYDRLVAINDRACHFERENNAITVEDLAAEAGNPEA